MARTIRALLFLAAVAGFAPTLSAPASPTRPPRSEGSAPSVPLRSAAGFGQLPLQFIPNRGQTAPAVAFYTTGRDRIVFFATEGLTVALVGDIPGGDRTGSARRWAVKLDFVESASGAKPVGLERSGAVVSYFTGRAGDRAAGLAAYEKIVYRDLWPGIDLIYSGGPNSIKSEFIVRPGADPSRIALRCRGAESVSLTADGRLALRTPAGTIEEDAPIAYQEIRGARRSVPVAYDLEGETCGFEVGAYDEDATLIVDPSSLVYSGFIGGPGADAGAGIALGADGSAYVVGTTASLETGFPATAGPDLTYNGGDQDVFVAKVAPDGTGLVYCGYIGGAGADRGAGVAVDVSGNAYVTGTTSSSESTFPVGTGPDLTFNGYQDVFVAKVDPAGTSLLYCGYVGGVTLDQAGGIAVDGAGAAYLCGTTGSDERSFPVKVGPDLVHEGSFYDAFVAKVVPSGAELAYCGYIGGVDGDNGAGIAVDAAGCAYVSGTTASSELDGFPVTVGPCLNFQGGLCDAYVAKVNALGASLDYCGYVGRPGTDFAAAIALDAAGSVYCVGNLYFDSEPPDVTLSTVNPSGTAVVDYRSFGGTGDDRAVGVAVDGWGNVYIAGHTNSNTNAFPETVGPGLVRKYYMDYYDPFVMKLDASGVGPPVYCGFIAGYGDDRAAGIAVDGLGSAYVVGTAGDGDWSFFPTIVGPSRSYGGGDSDAFISKVLPVPAVSHPVLISIEPSTVLAGDRTVTFTLRGADLGDGAIARWYGSGRPTRFISDTQLEVENGVHDLVEGRTCEIYIENPDGQTAGPVTLTIDNPVPRLDALSPAVVPAAGNVTRLRLLGANFLRNSIVRWNGAVLSSGWDAYVNMEALDVTIPPAELAAGGVFQVSVENPEPAGGTTVPLAFRIATFSLNCATPRATVGAGGAAVFPILLTPLYGPFDAAVSFDCFNLPPGCAASFSPAGPTPGAGPLDVVLTVTTTARSGSAAAAARDSSGLLPPGLVLLAGAWVVSLRFRSPRGRRRSGRVRRLAFAASVCLLLISASCGPGGSDGPSGQGTPPGTYQLTVRATSGGLAVAVPLTLVVR